jgi:YD repeat-containing protein
LFRRLVLSFLLVAGLCCAAGQAADTTYTYDMLGRVIRADYPNGNSTLYTYDAAGNRTAVSTSVLSAQPTAVPDSEETNQDTAKTYDPRVNDISVSAMTIIATGAPFHGSVVINSGMTLTYTPAPGYFGTDTFFYTIANGSGGQSYALDTITIDQTFPPPTAGPVTETTDADTPVTFDPRSAATGDGIVLTGTPVASHGTVVNNSGATLSYTPATGYVGGDSFTYTVTDIHSQSASNTVTMTVSAPLPPAPECDQTFGNPPRMHVFDCRVNSSLTMTAITQPTQGSALLSPDGTTITFTAEPGQSGVYDFTYTVKNSFNQTATGPVVVTITGP